MIWRKNMILQIQATEQTYVFTIHELNYFWQNLILQQACTARKPFQQKPRGRETFHSLECQIPRERRPPPPPPRN